MSTNRILVPVVALSALALVLAGCAVPVPSGPLQTDDRVVAADVHAVSLETSGRLDVVIGDQPGLTISAPARLIDRLTSESVDGVLTLGSTGGPFFNAFDSIRYTLTLPAVDALHILGSGDSDIDFAGADQVEIRIDGSGDVRAVGIDAGDVNIAIAGSGDVSASGAADHGEFTVDGSGDLDASELKVSTGTVDISGSGDVSVDATNRLDAQVSGSGEVDYRGSPQLVSDVSGSGSVSSR